MGDRYTNKAGGQSRVGVQASVVHGDVTVGATADDVLSIADRIVDLRRALDAARSSGALDDETVAAAQAELGAAAEHGDANDERGRNRAVLALKKVMGLVGDVADLAAKVATTIAAVKGAP
jgi:hypothetical protein